MHRKLNVGNADGLTENDIDAPRKFVEGWKMKDLILPNKIGPDIAGSDIDSPGTIYGRYRSSLVITCCHFLLHCNL